LERATAQAAQRVQAVVGAALEEEVGQAEGALAALATTASEERAAALSCLAEERGARSEEHLAAPTTPPRDAPATPGATPGASSAGGGAEAPACDAYDGKLAQLAEWLRVSRRMQDLRSFTDASAAAAAEQRAEHAEAMLQMVLRPPGHPSP
jgi:hypothetical protein